MQWIKHLFLVIIWYAILNLKNLTFLKKRLGLEAYITRFFYSGKVCIKVEFRMRYTILQICLRNTDDVCSQKLVVKQINILNPFLGLAKSKIYGLNYDRCELNLRNVGERVVLGIM